VADADHHRHLADLLGEVEHRGEHIGACLPAAHDLQQLHDIGRREEMHAEHILRSRRCRGDLVDVEIGGVAGEDRARPR
jgi:hypothetical protein